LGTFTKSPIFAALKGAGMNISIHGSVSFSLEIIVRPGVNLDG